MALLLALTALVANIQGTHESQSRMGISVLAIARGCQPLGAAYGSLAGLRQSVPRAELNALLELAKRTDGDIVCVVDCEYVAKGYRRGPRAVHRSHADLWSQLWRARFKTVLGAL